MRVEPLVPDVAAPASAAAPAPAAAGSAFGALVDAAGAALQSADSAERAFIAHRGGLAEMIVERARADIALQIAASGAQRAAQSLQTLLGMQI
jgi:flagellar hook-basal body complex protein FliE